MSAANKAELATPHKDGLPEGPDSLRLLASEDHAPSTVQKPSTRKRVPEIQNLVKILQSYNPKADLDGLHKAYEFANHAHEGQTRGTGEPYITHPLNVAIILAEMRLDMETLQAAILHDTIEDTQATFDEITTQFGPTVAHLVEGVTKLGAIPKLRAGIDTGADKTQRDAHQQAENLRKMFLAMFDDPRVVLIKLADRLHNMRTLNGIPAA